MFLEIPPLDPKLPTSVENSLAALCTALHQRAGEQERTGLVVRRGLPMLKASGLLTLAVPAQFGGKGASWGTVLDSVRRVAKVSSALAGHLACQAVQVATIQTFADGERPGELLFATASRDWLWGGVQHAAASGLRVSPVAGGYQLDGVPAAHWAVAGCDRVLLAARLGDGSGALVAAVDPSGGAIAQRHERQAGSPDETLHVELRHLQVAERDLLADPRAPVSTFATLRPLLEQLAQVHLYLGICQAALSELVTQVREVQRGSRQLRGGPVELPPPMVHRYAELWTDLKATSALARSAARSFEDAWSEGPQLDPAERGRLALEVAEARQLAARAGAQLSQAVFEAMSSGPAQAAHLESWWRRLRVHGLHDPVDFRRRELGRWILSGELPRASLFA